MTQQKQRLTSQQKEQNLATALVKLLNGTQRDIETLYGVYDPQKGFQTQGSSKGAERDQQSLKRRYSERYQQFLKDLRKGVKISTRFLGQEMLTPRSEKNFLTLADLLLKPCEEVLDQAREFQAASSNGQRVTELLRNYIIWHNAQANIRDISSKTQAGMFYGLSLLNPIRTRGSKGEMLFYHFYELDKDVRLKDPELYNLMHEFEFTFQRDGQGNRLINEFEYTSNPNTQRAAEDNIAKHPRMLLQVILPKLKQRYAEHYTHAVDKLRQRKNSIFESVKDKIDDPSNRTTGQLDANRFRGYLEDSGSDLGIVE